MSGKRINSVKNQASTSTNLIPDPTHGGLARFGDVLVTRLFAKELQPAELKLQDPAVRAIRRLQSAAGVRCMQKPDDSYVVKFNDWDAVDGYKKKFWIKFACEDGQWKTGAHVMPMCFNKKKLEAVNTGESLHIGQFLVDCKTLVESFTYRKQQFEELKDFLENSDLYYAVPHADPSYRVFTIRLQRNVENCFKDPFLIVVRLGYSENTTRPTSLVIESDSELPLAESDREVLHNQFKVLKQSKMAVALEHIFSSPGSEEIWKRTSPALEERLPSGKNNRSIRENDESSESDDSSQAPERRNEETLTSGRGKRSTLAEDSSGSSDSEEWNKNARASNKTRKKLKTVTKVASSGLGKKKESTRQKPALKASSSNRENGIAKHNKQKPSAKLTTKKKKT